MVIQTTAIDILETDLIEENIILEMILIAGAVTIVTTAIRLIDVTKVIFLNNVRRFNLRQDRIVRVKPMFKLSILRIRNESDFISTPQLLY